MRKRLIKFSLWILGTVVLGTTVYFALNYALGRNITPGGIQNTGTIKLNIAPNGNYSVLLDEQKVTPVNKEIIDNISPGEHKIRIQQEGYNSWEQIVLVNAGLVTDISIQLFPQTFEVEQITRTNVNKVFFSPSHRYVYYVVSNSDIGGSIGIWRQSLQENNIPLIEENAQKLVNLSPESLEALEKGTFDLQPSPNDTRVLLKVGSELFILPTNTQSTFETTRLTAISYPVEDTVWLSDNNLIIRSANTLVDYNVDTTNSSIIVYSPSNILYTKANSAVFYMRDGSLFSYRPGNNQSVKLENIKLPADIIQLRASTLNDANLVLSTKDQTNYFLNIDNSLLTRLGQFTIKAASHTLQNLIVSGSDGKLKGIEIKISLARNIIDVRSLATAIPTVENIVWSLDNKYLIYLSPSKKSLYSADQLGNNIVKIADFEFIVSPQSYGLVFNSSGAIVQLPENPGAAGSQTVRYNLYKIKFGT
jgi:hypothetical protein